MPKFTTFFWTQLPLLIFLKIMLYVISGQRKLLCQLSEGYVNAVLSWAISVWSDQISFQWRKIYSNTKLHIIYVTNFIAIYKLYITVKRNIRLDIGYCIRIWGKALTSRLAKMIKDNPNAHQHAKTVVHVCSCRLGESFKTVLYAVSGAAY